jgi:hypothetical protein
MKEVRPKCHKVFVKKTYQAQMYKWTPNCPDFTQKGNQQGKGGQPYYCTATAGSQGQDWTTSYVYTLLIVNSQAEHLAYVECDYVQ